MGGSGRSRCSRTIGMPGGTSLQAWIRESGIPSNRRSSTMVAWSSRSQGIEVRFLGHRDAQRQDVDEHPDHRLHPRQLGGPPGDRDAEEDVAPAAVPAQEHSPGALDQCAQGESTRSPQGLERGGHSRRQRRSHARDGFRDAPRPFDARPSSPSGVAAVTPLKACRQ